VFWNDGQILVNQGYDSVKDEVFFRPLGGGIKFGEHSAGTVAREIREEIGAELTGLRELGVIENSFTYDGQDMHEIVLVYDGQLGDTALYNREAIGGYEDDGVPFSAVWKPLSDFESGDILYPSGLVDLLRRSLPV
jgi:8-oxo-dGTP pyrophosphatase MutT (NUDIX family)